MRRILGLVTSAFLFRCATPEYQAYKENSNYRVGYTDTKLTSSMYRVKYVDVDSQKAYKNFMRRASQITLDNGFKYFDLKDVGALKENSINMGLGYGHSIDMALNQYEATIVMRKDRGSDSMDASEFLSINPVPVRKTSSQK
jgi:hypothetical protein